MNLRLPRPIAQYVYAVVEIDRLAAFLMEHYPREIGRVSSESAVDVATRLLYGMKEGHNG